MCVHLIGQEQKTHLLGEYLWESACIGKWKQAVYSPFAEEDGKFEVAGRGEEMASKVELWKLLGHNAWRGEQAFPSKRWKETNRKRSNHIRYRQQWWPSRIIVSESRVSARLTVTATCTSQWHNIRALAGRVHKNSWQSCCQLTAMLQHLSAPSGTWQTAHVHVSHPRDYAPVASSGECPMRWNMWKDERKKDSGDDQDDGFC